MEVNLHWETPNQWALVALREANSLLSDHAHCELGAAAAAQAILLRRPSDSFLVERMGAHAAEELQHFRQVHRLLRARGAALLPAEKNPYVAGMHRLVAAGRQASPRRISGADAGNPRLEDAGMVDRLLVAALVERRSLERFELLAQADRGGEIGALYGELAPSEAGHARLFLELALRLVSEEEVARRLEEHSRSESALIRGLPPGARIHSGPPGES